MTEPSDERVGPGGAAGTGRRGARSAAREAALHVLFAVDAGSPPPGLFDEDAAVAQLEPYWRARAEGGPDLAGPLAISEPEAREFAEAIVRGVASRLGEIDAVIRKASAHWRLERMARVDRTVLRIGAWELLRDASAPRAVVLDEAVELGKAYGGEDSGAFVNGVLDRVAEDLGRR
jgi:N utilization substance protein B